MPAQVTNYKCPACTGPLHFDGASGKLVCDYCGSSYETAEIEAMYAAADEKATQAQADAEAKAEKEAAQAAEMGMEYEGTAWTEQDGVKVYSCPSCGAELIFEETTSATSCPYCDNPTIVPGQMSGALKPDLIIPFKLDKKAAVEALRNHYKGKKLLPNSFKDQNHIEEIKGVYVPFWLFDGEASADVAFDATRIHTHTSGDYEITTTEHFDVRRRGNLTYEMVPADASSKMPDDYMDSIEPFDYSALTDFSTAYLPGYMADKYDVSQAECAERSHLRVSNTAVGAMEADVVGYTTTTMRSKDVRVSDKKIRYALMPVWLLSTKWQDKNYLFAMNGQTGKMIGDLPVDKGKYWTYFGITYVISAIVLFLITMFIF